MQISYEKREELGVRMKLMPEHIEREKKEQGVRKVIKVAESLRKKDGGLNENMFWKYTDVRFGLGKNSGKFYVAIDSNPIQHCWL